MTKLYFADDNGEPFLFEGYTLYKLAGENCDLIKSEITLGEIKMFFSRRISEKSARVLASKCAKAKKERAPENLNKTKAYLCGPMQYEEGRKWRESVSDALGEMGVIVLDPYKKPFVDSPSEDESSHQRLREMMGRGEFGAVSAHMKKVRSFDLSMVDKSDFLIFYINPDIFTAGTLEELSWSCRCKKPVFIVVEGGREKTPFWIMGMVPHTDIYNSFRDVLDVLEGMDNGGVEMKNDRWRLLKKNLR